MVRGCSYFFVTCRANVSASGLSGGPTVSRPSPQFAERAQRSHQPFGRWIWLQFWANHLPKADMRPNPSNVICRGLLLLDSPTGAQAQKRTPLQFNMKNCIIRCFASLPSWPCRTNETLSGRTPDRVHVRIASEKPAFASKGQFPAMCPGIRFLRLSGLKLNQC